MDLESIISKIIFFPSIKNGSFDYSTPLKSNITKFDIDKTYEPSQSLFEYLCYKIVKNKILQGHINSETVLITEKFFSTLNCKKIFIKANAIHKKHIIIFLQNKLTSKWNLIIFLNLEEQLKQCFDEKNKQPITAKIISSNNKSEEDDFILNSTMDKLENTFNFKSPDDIQFEVDSINISDQPNTSIFILNFIDQLIIQDDAIMSSYIKKLYDEGSNNQDPSSRNYFNSFNNINSEFQNIYTRYQNELNEYFKKNKNNIINFDVEKIMNGNNEIFSIEKNNEIKNSNEILIEENGTPNSSPGLVNGMDKLNSNKNKMKDDIDMIQIEQDDDLDSDEEEEALKIMERENQEAKSQMREQERKLRQRLYKQKLRLKNINMYKEFGIIKEEDNESESESIDIFNKIKDEKEFNDTLRQSLQKSMESKKKNYHNKNYINTNLDNNKIMILNTDNNNTYKNEKILFNNNNNNNDKELVKKENDKEQRNKSEKSIKLSVLRDLEEAIEEFETEQEPIKTKEGNVNININKKKNNSIENESKPAEKKNGVKIDNFIDENKKEKKYINIFKNNVFKENLEFNKKRGSLPKSKEKERTKEDKNSLNKNTEKLKKSFTTTKKPDKDKEKPKEKNIEDILNKNNKTNSLTKKKSFKDNICSTKQKEHNNKTIKSNNSSNSNRTKDLDSTSNNTNTNAYNTNSFNSNSNSSKSNNDQDKYIKDKDIIVSNKKELSENISTKNTANNTVKMKNTSKNKTSQNTKKTTTKKGNDKQTQIPFSIKSSINSQKSSLTSRTGEMLSQLSEERNSTKKNKKYKEIEINLEKNIPDFSAIDNPMNSLPPPKKVERNRYYDLTENNKDRFENGSCSNFKINLNGDINSVKSEKINGDTSSNINIENIFSDDFESEKNDKDDGSIIGENRTKKTMVRRGDKKKYPPRKPKTIPRAYNDYCNYDEDGATKICGCIGEQSNGLCLIF